MENNRVLRDNLNFWLEEDAEYPPGKGSIFLCYRCPDSTESRCVGGALEKGNLWIADIDYPLDNDSHIDFRVIYEGESRDEALESLWEQRFNTLRNAK